MRSRIVLVAFGAATILVGCGTSTPVATAGVKRHLAEPAQTVTVKGIGRFPLSYGDALRPVDLYLAAWLSGDVRTAAEQLVPTQRRMFEGTQGRAVFLGETGGHPVSYEVIGAQMISPSEYQFDVWMYVNVPGAYGPGATIPRARPVQVTVRRSASSGWLLQSIPGASHGA